MLSHASTYNCHVQVADTLFAVSNYIPSSVCRLKFNIHEYYTKYLLSYLRSWALLDNLQIEQQIKNFPAFYGIRKFITVLTRIFHWSLPEPDRSSPHHPIIFIENLLSYSPRTYVLAFQVVYFLLTFPPISYMHSFSPHSCYKPCSSFPTSFDHSNYVWRGVQIMKLLIMQFSPISRHFSLRTKHSPQHPVLKHPQSMFFS
jgi:hypothetical protein